MSGKRCYKENGGGSFGYSSVSKQKTIRTFLCKNILKLLWECDCVGYGHDYIHTYILYCNSLKGFFSFKATNQLK